MSTDHLLFSIGREVYAVLANGTDGYPVVEAEVTGRRTEYRPSIGQVNIIEARSKTTNHGFAFAVEDELFPGTTLHIDWLDAIEESGRRCQSLVERTRRERAEWNAMTNAEQCAHMGYGIGRYTGD